MRKLLALCLLLLAAPASGSVRNCTAALVTAGICASATDVLLAYSISTTDPDGAGVKLAPSVALVEGIAFQFNYQATVGGVANPESKSQFADRMMRSEVLPNYYRLWIRRLADLDRQAREDADPTPSTVGN
jgi:hypothetical protein